MYACAMDAWTPSRDARHLDHDHVGCWKPVALIHMLTSIRAYLGGFSPRLRI